MSNNRSFSSRLFVNSIWNASAYIFSTFIGIISAPLYINILGIKQYGLFILLTSILLPFGLLNFGFAEATIKYVSESIAKGLYDEANEYVRSTLLFNILVGLFGSITIIVSARFLSTRIFKIEASDQLLAEKILYWIAATWFVNQVSATFSGIPVAF